jgi:DNA (cytosine-5)-methyltransferase 1
MNKINVIDIFCGAGGLSYGFYKNKNFNLICANDIEKDMTDTYKSNHKEIPVYNMDIKEFNLDLLSKDLGVSEKDIDIIIGGPPCQAFSTVGKRLLEDPRGKLFQEFYRLVEECKPKMFLFENVKGLISMDKGNLLKHIINLFKDINYNVEYRVLNACDYGVPQSRERVFIVGTLDSKEFSFPNPTHSEHGCLVTEKYIPLKDAISDLPELGINDSKDMYTIESKNNYQSLLRDTDKLTEHSSPNNNNKLVNLMKALPDGGNPLDIDESLRPKSGFKNTYCRLWWEKPCTTITRNFSTPSSSRCIHPKQPRPLSPREALRIQSFPDSYTLKGSMTSKRIQIGNAVPPLLSIHLAKAVEDYFKS